MKTVDGEAIHFESCCSSFCSRREESAINAGSRREYPSFDDAWKASCKYTLQPPLYKEVWQITEERSLVDFDCTEQRRDILLLLFILFSASR